ncbi:hypothetical protein ABT040_43325 [Streptomyces sp. NPDC002688]|uniref:hypothetical protein n=1 Tax=Streptomyces sp. NPDC002688 TaxID=3154423 RepID=UPI003322B4A1
MFQPALQTKGAAEMGRELDDAGGPLLVGAVAAATTPAYELRGARDAARHRSGCRAGGRVRQEQA